MILEGNTYQNPVDQSENIEQPTTNPEQVTIDVAFSGAATAAEIHTKAKDLCAGKAADELASIASEAWNVCGTSTRTLTEQANWNRLIIGSVLLCIKDQCQHGEFEQTIAPVLEKLGCSRGTIWKLMKYASVPCVDKYISNTYEKVRQAYKLAENRFPKSPDPIGDLLQMVGVQDLDDVDVFGNELPNKLRAVELVAECGQTGLTLDDALRLAKTGYADDSKALKDTLTNNIAAGKSAHEVVDGILGDDIPLKKQAKPKKAKGAAGFEGCLKTFLKALGDENKQTQPTLIDPQTASEFKQGIETLFARWQTTTSSSATTTATLPDTPSAAAPTTAPSSTSSASPVATPPPAASATLPPAAASTPTTATPAAASASPSVTPTPAVIPATTEAPTPEATTEPAAPATPQ